MEGERDEGRGRERKRVRERDGEREKESRRKRMEGVRKKEREKEEREREWKRERERERHNVEPYHSVLTNTMPRISRLLFLPQTQPQCKILACRFLRVVPPLSVIPQLLRLID